MKHTNMAIAMIALVASAVAQAPNRISPDEPNLREPFTKACVKALMAIRDFKGTAGLTGPAKDAYEDARTQANSANAPEILMIANLTNFAIMRSADRGKRCRRPGFGTSGSTGCCRTFTSIFARSQ